MLSAIVAVGRLRQKSLVILGIEVFVFQVISMTLVGLIVLDVRDQCIEVELLLVYYSGGAFSSPLALKSQPRNLLPEGTVTVAPSLSVVIGSPFSTACVAITLSSVSW